MNPTRDYLDYNATSPLATSVKEYLAKGDLPFANPASIHSTGKQTKSIIRDVTIYLQNTFALPDHQVIYHSGATESINTIFSGLGDQDALVHSSVDHPSVIESAKSCRERGVWVEEFSVDCDGNFNLEQLISKVATLSQSKRRVLVNFTYGNNETGALWPLSWAVSLKQQTGCDVHVDAVQIVGKIPSLSLAPELDMYTFSAHKFGALKGVGFTLLKNVARFGGVMLGGAQQFGRRAGTENVLGIQSIQLALKETLSTPVEQIENFRNQIEVLFAQTIGAAGQVVAQKSKAGRLVNTSLLLFHNHNADFLLVSFDLAGMDVSMGAACSSQSLKKSHVLTGMGITHDQNAIRLSLGPANLLRQSQILERLSGVFKKLA